MSPITQLDIVLNKLSTEETLKPYADEPTLLEYLSQHYPNIVFNAQRILDKLVEDKFLSFRYGERKEYGAFDYVERLYFTTFEGDLFCQSGGYQGQLDRENAENTRLERIEKTQKMNQTYLTWLTALIAVGTLIAAWYYGIEIWKHYHTS